MSEITGARRPRGPRGALETALALAAAATFTLGLGDVAAAACPWIVQPSLESPMLGGKEPPVYDVVFNGPGYNQQVFYGFTVASLDLQWQLAAERRLPELRPDGRKLEPTITSDGITAYRVAPDTIRPHTIYLVAASSEVDELEAIGARIKPATPIAVSQLLPRTRGGSDLSGPLPHRSVPGFEIAGNDRAQVVAGGSDVVGRLPANAQTAMADVQICAYEVAALR